MDNTDIVVDFFQNVTLKKPLESKKIIRDGKVVNKLYEVIVIQSDGTITLNDSWLTCLKWQQSVDKPHVTSKTLQSYLDLPIFDEIDTIHSSMPDDCQKCCWMHLCGAGDIENRYSEKTSFNQKSIFCEGLKIFYSHVVSYLVNNGYPLEGIEKKLKLADVASA